MKVCSISVCVGCISLVSPMPCAMLLFPPASGTQDISAQVAPFKWTGVGLIIGGGVIVLATLITWFILRRRTLQQAAAKAEGATDPLAKNEQTNE